MLSSKNWRCFEMLNSVKNLLQADERKFEILRTFRGK